METFLKCTYNCHQRGTNPTHYGNKIVNHSQTHKVPITAVSRGLTLGIGWYFLE